MRIPDANALYISIDVNPTCTCTNDRISEISNCRYVSVCTNDRLKKVKHARKRVNDYDMYVNKCIYDDCTNECMYTTTAHIAQEAADRYVK